MNSNQCRGLCLARAGPSVFCLLGREAAECEDVWQVDQPFQHDAKRRRSPFAPIQTGDQVWAEFSAKIPRDDRCLQPDQSWPVWDITSQGPVFIQGHPQVLRRCQRRGHRGGGGHWGRPHREKAPHSSSVHGEPPFPVLHTAQRHQHHSLLWKACLSLSAWGWARLRVTEEAQGQTCDSEQLSPLTPLRLRLLVCKMGLGSLPTYSVSWWTLRLW